MLNAILKSRVASNVNVNIMRVFVLIRNYISTNLLEHKYINNQVMKIFYGQNKDFPILLPAIAELSCDHYNI